MNFRPYLIAVAFVSFTLFLNSCSENGGSTYSKTAAVRPPVMGWSSWNAFAVNISDSIIIHQADLLVDLGLKEVGYNHVNVDDGFFGKRDSNGRMTPHPERFPQGMKVVADYIHSLGMKAGIYSDAGNNTCGSIWNDDKNGVGAGLFGHDAEDAEQYFNEWGFDFIKIDYCGGQTLGLDEQARYLEIRSVIDSMAKKPIEINICRWAYPGTWVSKAGDSWRISGDIRPRWESIKYIIEKNLYLSAFSASRTGGYNDMDMLVVGFGLDPVVEETHFGLWCMFSSPLLIGCDLSKLSETSLRLLKNKELIAVDQDPLGEQARVVKYDGETYVLAKDLKKARGESRAVAFYNPMEEEKTVSVTLSEIGFEGDVSVRDLFRHEDLQNFSDNISLPVKPHGVKIFSVSGKRCEPSVYEAEWAYIPTFSDIAKERCGRVVPADYASGKVVVGGLGGSEDNRLEWDDVYANKAGTYRLSVDFCSPYERELDVLVNGKKYASDVMVGSSENSIATFSVEVPLNRGYNVVSVGNPKGEAPYIDCIRVNKK